MTITRKCAKCGEKIVIDENNLNEVVYFDKSSWHLNCFIESIPKKMASKSKAVRDEWSNANNTDAVNKSSQGHFLAYLYRDTIYNYIREQYDITVIPNAIWTRLSDIYTGKYKSMSEPIHPSILLDMWQRKMGYLNKTCQQNITRGKVFKNTTQRIIYDLAVLVNKYDSYKAYMEKQKILAAEIADKAKQDQTAKLTEMIVKETPNVKSSSEGNDFADLVDDIFS